ncbi:MAG: polysaccharide deacetylase family protein [Bacillota bacterium]
MKRRIISLFLCLLLLLPMAQAAFADSTGICFTATNDTLLPLSAMTVYISGAAYVPASVFAPLGVYMTYFESRSTAFLYNSSKHIFFELTTGNSYDSAETTYSVSATLKNGQVYVPVGWMCDYFGLSYSPIPGNGNGDVMRIKNGSQYLTDAVFLEAASSSMRTQYNEYYGKSDPSSPQPSQNVKPSDPGAASLSLSFLGLPETTLLDSLASYGVNACFFLTAEEAAQSPELIRTLIGAGHNVGIHCELEAERECESAAELIFEAAQTRTTLLYSTSAIAREAGEYAAAGGYAYFTPALTLSESAVSASAVLTKLEDISGYISLLIPANENAETYLPTLLQFIAGRHITVLPLRETLV